ncbi:BamA/TamA family outer membrane protein [Myroides odoratimimus]|uniref:Outer membrane protein assembly factor BamA n=3 Tax=Myroides odoratimimus TaxID=76832 RepID=A0A0S7E429_9FLAO|nr:MULTISPECIES: POTRA domain-containing protein [Myroides]AJA68900.1 Outer membrane protein/protective antigen OMA87 [Myroides sp. A21]ALU26161.1 outer membrane protein assembly factor BamA [Myroides odoratimimus]APA92203.1 outer membrane protein assembly factor BamA [Myroides sp. ZB35]EHO11493.1 outer membrane protein assembly complex, YaeT protein [Myroides odoratimimus CCUG 10230]EHO14137.1 outer membrane protein assembly complex, YaeT protein [Myroides odoratimimus CCUG 12901]
MFQKGTSLFALFIAGLVYSHVHAQDSIKAPSFEAPKIYTLGDITVTGKYSLNPQTIVTFTGLSKGQKIAVPGEELSHALTKLWKVGSFTDINFYETSVVNDTINLELTLNELPRLKSVKIKGFKKAKSEALIKEAKLNRGKIVNDNFLSTTKYFLLNKYKKDGYYNTKVTLNTIPADSTGRTVELLVGIDKGKKVRIEEIAFSGNTQLSDKKLKKAMKETKQRSPFNPLRIFKPSKFIKAKYEEDLDKLVSKYKENGYRDARIIADTTSYNPETNRISINIDVTEGNKYYFGDIRFIGNTVYTNSQLKQVLGIEKGDVYNGVLLDKRIDDKTDPDGYYISNVYQNNGYLFSNVNPVEVRTANDTIDFEVRIVEGPIARFNNITVSGNDNTHDHVVHRDIRTRPGEIWSKSLVMETIRRLGGLNIFDAQAIIPDVKNADPNSGTVDIDWQVTEKGSSQVELQGGYGGGGFIGTLGLSFNNFSLRNIFNKKSYKPFPMGDGQSLSLRLQGSTYYQTYSISFSEPWFGGRKPINFFGTVAYSTQNLYDYVNRRTDRSRGFDITTLQFGIAKQLSVPDDNFVLSHTLSFQYYNMKNYNTGLFTFGDGDSRNLAYQIELRRDNRGNDPIFPTFGSFFSVSGKFTAPYSLFNNVDYKNLGDQQEYKLRAKAGAIDPVTGATIPVGTYLDSSYRPVNNWEDATADVAKVDQKKFNWLEYYKLKFKGDWYTTIYDKLVVRALGEFGYMGAYNNNRGVVPFERFYVGGDGLANYSLDGREVIQLRGYQNQTLTPYNDRGEQIGGTIYNKFSLELRYPITLKPSASVYVLTFAEAGNSFASFKDYSPFELKRSAGFGVRVFMPMFGLLGIDFGYGFDSVPGTTQKSGFQTHFILGQSF